MSNRKHEVAEVEPRSRWHLPAVILCWLVVIGAMTFSAYMNREYALGMPSAATGNSRSEWVHAGLPFALLVALAVAEMAVVAKAHGTARIIGHCIVGFVALTVFSASYYGIMTVFTDDDSRTPVPILWALAAVPDALAVGATVILVSLRMREEARRGRTVTTTPKQPGYLSQITANLGDRAVAATAKKPAPAPVTPTAPVQTWAPSWEPEPSETLTPAEPPTSTPTPAPPSAPAPVPATMTPHEPSTAAAAAAAPGTAEGDVPESPRPVGAEVAAPVAEALPVLPEPTADEYAEAVEIVAAGVKGNPDEAMVARVLAASRRGPGKGDDPGMSIRELADALPPGRNTITAILRAAEGVGTAPRALTVVGGDLR